MYRNSLISFLAALCVCVYAATPLPALAQAPPDSITYMEQEVDPFRNFFDSEEALDMRLTYDMKTFQRTSSQEKYHAAMLTVFDEDSCAYEYPVRLKTRGVFRKSYCSIPPFWLNITRSGIDSESFDGMKKMKVVTHCLNKDYFQDYVLKEYLAYKMYSIVSPYSFKVRLLRITYVNTGRANKETQAWGFAVEPRQLMARRLDATLVDNEFLAMKHMDPDIMDHLALFDYMIGNTDYSITGQHNIKVLKLNKPASESDPAGYIPVPYDFDFTGIVNTVYAKPASSARISTVTSRYYTGPCRSDDVFERLLNDFSEHRDAIHHLLQPFEYMHLKDKLEMLKFIETFFDEIAADGFIDRRLHDSCM